MHTDCFGQNRLHFVGHHAKIPHICTRLTILSFVVKKIQANAERMTPEPRRFAWFRWAMSGGVLAAAAALLFVFTRKPAPPIADDDLQSVIVPVKPHFGFAIAVCVYILKSSAN